MVMTSITVIFRNSVLETCMHGRCFRSCLSNTDTHAFFALTIEFCDEPSAIHGDESMVMITTASYQDRIKVQSYAFAHEYSSIRSYPNATNQTAQPRIWFGRMRFSENRPDKLQKREKGGKIAGMVGIYTHLVTATAPRF